VCQGRHYFSFYGLHNEPSGNRERKAKKYVRAEKQRTRNTGKGAVAVETLREIGKIGCLLAGKSV